MVLTNRDRRRLLKTGLMLAPALALGRALPAAAADEPDIDKRLEALEQRLGGRLGVSVLDTQTEVSFGRREDEAFPLCSTFKILAAGLVLKRVDAGQETLDRRISFPREKLVSYSPGTEKHAGGDGMTMAEICKAAITLSDNTAGNLMLESLGGPEALTAWLRGLGDSATRLDRWETDLNEAKPGDVRDTTTPAAMRGLLGELALGDTLSEASRRQLADWMKANTTGGKRLRAGIPADWAVGDKTGTSGNGAAGDVALVYPPGRAPILVSAYMGEATAPVEALNAGFAEIGAMAADMV